MAETYELARMLTYTIGALRKYPVEVAVIEELGCLMAELHLINRMEKEALEKEDGVLSFWNRINDAKEIYRDKTFSGISGKKTVYSTESLAELLEGFKKTVDRGIEKACRIGGGICPTYFTYEVPEYEVQKEGIRPLSFQVKEVPYFLEGPVRYLKLDWGWRMNLSGCIWNISICWNCCVRVCTLNFPGFRAGGNSIFGSGGVRQEYL